MAKKGIILAMIMILIFSFVSVVSILSNAWPFLIISFLFVLFLIASLTYSKKTLESVKLIHYFLWIILIYILIKFFSLSVKEDVWYKGILLVTANLIDSDFVLILVTALYVAFTFMMFTEMKKARITSQRPNIIVRPEQEGAWSLVYLIIRNIGGSPAFDAKAKYYVTKNDNTVEESYWSHSVLQSIEKVKLVLDNKGIHNFFKDNKKLEVHIAYRDKERNKFREKLTFDLKELLDGIEKTKWAVDKDREYQITKSLGEISKEMKKVSRSLDYLSDESKIKKDKRDIKELKKRYPKMKLK